MPFQKITNVRVAGIAAAVPERIVEAKSWTVFASNDESDRYVKNVGIERLHRHDGNMCCSDLCQHAAENLLSKLGWNAGDVDLLIYAAVARDYVQPPTACVLHGKMGLKKDCASFDVPQGCSGWMYGMAIAASMIACGGVKKALVMAGDAEPMGPQYPTRSDLPMFGDAGTATALEYVKDAPEMIICTETIGAGYEAIIRRDGGDRSPVCEGALDMIEDAYGHRHRGIDKEMNGPSVFSFSLSDVPKLLNRVMTTSSVGIQDIDYFVLHQANKMINERLCKKMKFPVEKCPSSLSNFGNTSAASIPLTICTEIPSNVWKDHKKTILACGFGVGFSLAAALFTLQKSVILPLLTINQ